MPALGVPRRITEPYGALDPSFGTAVAVTASAVAIAAPFENVARDGGNAPHAGATYLFELTNPLSSPTRIVVPNADPYDGQASRDVLPPDVVTPPEPWPTFRLALSDRLLVVGVAGDDSGTLDPTDNSATESGAVWSYDRADLDNPDARKRNPGERALGLERPRARPNQRGE